jgi:hypothetical protein
MSAILTGIFKSSAAGLLILGAISSVSKRPFRAPSLWTKEGKDGLSCTSCHSPSGREIWDSAIKLEDVKRRAMVHLSEADASALAAEIGDIRSQEKLHPNLPRPFHPNAPDLAGTNPSQRDDAFGQSLTTIVPKLARHEIWTLEEAEAAAEELCSRPLETIVPGFPLDPLSRDPIRVNDGPVLGDWIPDIGLSRRGTVAFEKACAAHKDATGEYDIPAIEAEITKAEGPPKSGLDQMSRLKRLALLRYESFLETGRRGALVPRSPAIPDDPVWAIGKMVALSPEGPPEQWGMDGKVALRVGATLGKTMDLKPMALSWMWVGWTLDPSLQSTSGDRFTRIGLYLLQMLWDAGPYPWHAAYFACRRPIEERRLGRPGAALQPEFNAFVNNDVLESNAPKDTTSRAAFTKFCANLLRMNLLLVEKDLTEGRKLANTASAVQQLNALWSFVKSTTPSEERHQTSELVERVITRIGKA